MGSPRCELWPWIQHSWAGEHSSAWDSQLLKGHCSIIGALITPSVSLASFCSADSTGRLEGFAVAQRHRAAATWSGSFPQRKGSLAPPSWALHSTLSLSTRAGTSALVRHTKAKAPSGSLDCCPRQCRKTLSSQKRTKVCSRECVVIRPESRCIPTWCCQHNPARRGWHLQMMGFH